MKKHKSHKKKKKSVLIRILPVICVICIIFGIFSGSFKSGTAKITVPEGASSRQIAQILKDNGVIYSKTLFLARLSISPYKGKLQYGSYKLDKGEAMSKIIKTLATEGAKKSTVTLTIPEGYSVEKIKERVVEIGLCTETEFENALKAEYDYAFLKSVPNSKDIKYKLQGFLYPSTYEFYTGETAENVIKTMLGEFNKQISPLSVPDNQIYDLITKASIVEREAKIAAERTKIAGVIENRLKSDMRLQVDATVTYDLSDGLYNISKLYYKDLNKDSKYNTYKYKGLPIGPICCPGIQSIKAAYSPEKHKYLYYHTDESKNDGSHIFTETYEEHTTTQK